MNPREEWIRVQAPHLGGVTGENLARAKQTYEESLSEREFASVLSDGDELSLHRQGYYLTRVIGEGHTSIVFEVKKPLLNHDGILYSASAVAKVSKPVRMDSATTLINRSRKERNRVEAMMGTTLKHKNLVDILDVVEGEHGLITIQELIRGPNLSQMLRWDTSREKFFSLFSQATDVVEYLHGQDILHRDIKPSNFFIEDETLKLGDLQNAGHLDDLLADVAATRGGTAYSHIDLLNGIMTGDPVVSTKDTDRYSLSVCMYEFMTGKKPFDIKMVIEEDGRRVEIEPIDVQSLGPIDAVDVQLEVDGKPVDQITPEMAKEMLDGAIQKLPKEYKDLKKPLREGLDPTTIDYSVRELFSDMKKIDEGWRGALRNFGRRHRSPLLALAGVGLVSFGGALGVNLGDKILPNDQVVYEVIQHPHPIGMFDRNTQHFRSARSGMLEPELHTVGTLFNYYEEIREKYTRNDPLDALDSFEIRAATELNGLNRRLFTSLVRSSLSYAPSEGERVGRFHLPEEYIFSFFNHDELGAHVQPMEVVKDRVPPVAPYLKASQFKAESIVDVFVNYFCSNEEIFVAQERARNRNYFATPIPPSGVVQGGYGAFLPKKKKQLVNSALVWYAITDEKGEPHFDIDLDDVFEREWARYESSEKSGLESK